MGQEVRRASNILPVWTSTSKIDSCSIVIKILPVTTCMRKAVGFLGKDVSNRLHERYEGGKKPDDLIQWLIDAAPPVEKTVYQIVERVMALNVASIHTTTMVCYPFLD